MIIFILRHADRTAEDHLSLKGRKRAELLARMLGESGVSIAYRSDATRTEETLAPLKRRLGTKLRIKKISIAGSDGLADHVKTIIDDIHSLPDKTVVVVVGHSNTIGPIVEGLGGRPGVPIGENEFDRLIILATPTPSAVDEAQIKFGEATP